MAINPHHALVCCIYCGRDTRTVRAICNECRGIRDGRERRGRKARPTQVTGGDPRNRDDGKGDEDHPSDLRYHGSHLD